MIYWLVIIIQVPCIRCIRPGDRNRPSGQALPGSRWGGRESALWPLALLIWGASSETLYLRRLTCDASSNSEHRPPIARKTDHFGRSFDAAAPDADLAGAVQQ